ncbi:MAG: DNA-3-methyladenine glycosylase 2 family protein [Gammaproteobacteria bacterium]|nr:DNA-3-methyladenine glycosylase 2 family protein [Gammaproteobacteria bacterium]
MNSTIEPIEIHSAFLKISANVSTALVEALCSVGPISFPERKDKDLGRFLARVVIGQQLSTKAAQSIWSKAEAAALLAGVSITEYFSATDAELLRQCGVSRNKIKALRSLHGAERKGVLCAETLLQLDHDMRSEQLTAIWGIGRWTCDMVSIFYCHCPDIWPETDLAVQKTFANLVGRRCVSEVAMQFTPFRSFLALAMWRFVDRLQKK